MAGERDPVFWLRWVLANALGKVVGLSVVLIVGFGLLGLAVGDLPGAWPAVLSLLAGVLLGAFEGVIVGWAQGSVLRRRLPGMRLRTWILATVAGAMVAWGLGMLPSTLMAGAPAGSQGATEPPEWLTLVMAAGLGLVAVILLALAQWLVLRSRVRRAWAWLPANALA